MLDRQYGQNRADEQHDHTNPISLNKDQSNNIPYTAGHIDLNDFNAADTSGWAHCWVTFKEQHEDAFKALLNAATEGGQFLYIPVGEVVLSGLSEDQILLLIEGREDLIYRESLDTVRVLEDIWYAVEEAVMQIAPDATRQRLVAVSLSVSERRMIDKLRTELEKHAKLHYASIEFGET